MAVDHNKSWLDARLNTTGLMKVMMTEYWIPKNINFLWSFGVVLATLFMLLVVSGMFLLMYYKPDTALAFDSVNKTIMHEVAYGWLFRHIHAVAASVVFLVIYIHMFVAIYYGSYKNGREIHKKNSSHQASTFFRAFIPQPLPHFPALSTRQPHPSCGIEGVRWG